MHSPLNALRSHRCARLVSLATIASPLAPALNWAAITTSGDAPALWPGSADVAMNVNIGINGDGSVRVNRGDVLRLRVPAHGERVDRSIVNAGIGAT